MKVEYNLDHSHFKVTCDKCFKEFTDEQIDTKERFCRCPHCNGFICGMGYLITRSERKECPMKSYAMKPKKSYSSLKSRPIKTKLMKRKVRVG